jgi:hypothetical protein
MTDKAGDPRYRHSNVTAFYPTPVRPDLPNSANVWVVAVRTGSLVDHHRYPDRTNAEAFILAIDPDFLKPVDETDPAALLDTEPNKEMVMKKFSVRWLVGDDEHVKTFKAEDVHIDPATRVLSLVKNGLPILVFNNWVLYEVVEG